MDRTLESFITVLRRAGVRVSVSETMDAVRAVALSGYEDRQLVKDFLAVSLAKSQPEKQIFENCFDHFFNIEGLGSRNALSKNQIVTPAEHLSAPLTQMLLSGSGGGLALAFREAALGAGIKDIQYPQQRGIYMQKLLQILGLTGLNEDIQKAAQGSSESAALAASLRRCRDSVPRSRATLRSGRRAWSIARDLGTGQHAQGSGQMQGRRADLSALRHVRRAD